MPFLQCKAWSDPLPADVITKLIGNIFLKNVSAGWLVTTGPLSKAAKGIMSEWENRTDKTRSKISFYTADRIINLLCDTKQIVSADVISSFASRDFTIGQNMILLLMEESIIGVIPILEPNNNFISSVIAYDAKTGSRIVDQ